jgi:hypothetical protein
MFKTLFYISLSIIAFATSEAQVLVTAPTTSLLLKSCDEFSHSELGNAWDMDDSPDINNYFLGNDVSGLNNITFSQSIFSGISNGTGSTLYLWSPAPCGSYPVGGRWGQDLNVDTTKYKNLSFKMYQDKFDPQGYRLIWDRSCNYANSRTVTLPSKTKVGWSTYNLDLTNATIDTSSPNKAGWNSGSVTGFALMPTTVSGSQIKLDWIKLEDPTTCGSTNVSTVATTQSNNNLYSVWLDNDSNPFNGFDKQIMTAQDADGTTDSVNMSTLSLSAGNYKLVSILDSDYRTLTLTDPWDMNESSDVLNMDVTSTTFQNGILSGTASVNQSIYLRIGDSGIAANKFKNLSIKINSSSPTQQFKVIWTNSSGDFYFHVFSPSDNLGNGVYQLSLNGQPAWNGQITTLLIQPTINNPVNFSLDFVSLRSTGFDTVRDARTLADSTVQNSTVISVNNPPQFNIREPDLRGGEALRAWNMNNNDLVVFSNLLDGNDSVNANEKYVTYLPDVRLVAGLRGDFFKGTNDPNSVAPDDAVNYSIFPFRNDSFTFSSAEYSKLCYKLTLDRPFDLGNGSVARVLWKASGGDFKNTEDLPLIYNVWSDNYWYEYCMDMSKVPLEETTLPGWEGQIEAFRVDPHEFKEKTSYYFDYIKLRKEDSTNSGSFNLVYNLSDNDSNAVIKFYYNTVSSTTGGTLIGQALENDNTRTYKWNTLKVPNGTYYIYAVADDSLNEVKRLATGTVKIANGIGTLITEPILSVSEPIDNATYCNNLLLSGFSLHQDRLQNVASIELLVNGTLIATLDEEEFIYSLVAKATYPSADSSNSGFRKTYDISSFSNGSLTVTIKAISTDGQITTINRNINKSSNNCPTFNEDPAPSGTSIPISSENLTPVATATPMPVASTPILAKPKLNNKGVLSLSVKNSQTGTESSCLLNIEVSTNKTTFLSTAAISVTNTTMNLEAKGIKIPNKKVPNLHFRVAKTCTGLAQANSKISSLKIKSKKGKLSTLEAIKNKLTTSLKVLKKKSRKK